jgi:hypothetical protein
MSLLLCVVVIGVVLGVIRAIVRLSLGDASLYVCDAMMLTVLAASSFAKDQYVLGSLLVLFALFQSFLAFSFQEKRP